MEWYYADAGQRVGPISEEEFTSLRAAGKIRPETLVWRAGMPDWQALSAVEPGTASVTNAEGVAYCSQCGRQFAPANLLSYGTSRVCATCKDSFFQTLREQGTVGTARGARRYAGFWIRLLAYLIDGLILTFVFLPLGIALGLLTPHWYTRPVPNPTPAELFTLFAGIGVLVTFEIAATAVYEGWFISRRGGTPGKLVLGLRVVRPDGEAVSFGRGVGRYFALILSKLVFYIGCIMAGFDEEKRALHDRLCDTRVIYKQV